MSDQSSPDNVADVSRQEQQPATRRRKTQRAFVYDSYPSRKIALRLAYHGYWHDGLAKQVTTENTVEGILCDALRRVRLISDVGPVDFSRCGRTDKGVSALGNAVALRARSSCAADATPQRPPLDYSDMLNNVLPPTIRVVGFALVADDFDARFSCVSRCYRYYFCHRGLDLAAMRRAASYLCGTHNFRNFCKPDVVNVSNFTRTVYDVQICPSELLPEAVSYLTITANSFLYHQIRCTMEVLFLVGRGLEEAEVVQRLVSCGDEKPVYPLADAAPLILWECTFDKLSCWQLSRRACQWLEQELQDICTALLLRASAAESMRRQLFQWYHTTWDAAAQPDRPATRADANAARATDMWAITGCDWTQVRSHERQKARRREFTRTQRQAEAGSDTGLGNYIPLLEREKERTYAEQVDLLTGKKRARYEINATKRAAREAARVVQKSE